MDLSLLGRDKLRNKGQILFLVHGAVHIVRRALVIAGGEKGAVHIHAFQRHDGCHRIIEMQITLRTEGGNAIGNGIAGEGAGGNDHLPLGDDVRLRMHDLNIGKSLQAFRDGAGKAHPIHRQSAAGGDPVQVRALQDEGAQPAHLFLQKANCIGELIAAQGVGADKLRKIVRAVSGTFFERFHFHKAHGDAPFGQLPGAFAAGKARAENRYSLHSLFLCFCRFPSRGLLCGRGFGSS